MIRLVIILLLQLFIADWAMASESAYVPTRRFVPLPPAKSNFTPKQIIGQPQARFFPLSQAHHPMPLRSEKTSIAANAVAKSRDSNNNFSQNSEELLPDSNTNQASGKKLDMSRDDAEQIISIFSANK